MKKPTYLLATMLCLAIILALLTSTSVETTKISSAPLPPQSAFEQNPPIPVTYWITLLKKPTARGESLIFKVQYESDGTLPNQISIYNKGSVANVLRDDGVYPDDIANDKKYACFRNDNPDSLVTKIRAIENRIVANGGVFTFNGHSGEFIDTSEIVFFDKIKFERYLDVEVDALLIDAADCDDEIKYQNSLFITDLSIVEDQSRTYNVSTGVGNATGVWTFGTLMANIDNNTHPNGLKGFLKDWVKSWTINQTVNSYTVKSRDFAIETMIAPWLKKAQNNSSLNITLANWESEWDGTSESALRNNAPFKLTAIVNRIDLRGNQAYNPSLENSGETRFIYTLIDPFSGDIPISPNQTQSQQTDGIGFFDWRGLNVIFEYGNVQNNACDLQELAQQWLDLSDDSYSFGTPVTNNTYKDALQDITDLVTSSDANPIRTNGSAINRIRTNEKVFATFDTGGGLTSEEAWELQDWEFRQFELNAGTGNLELVPVTNNPPVTANYAPNIEEDYSSTSPAVSNEDVLDWIYNGNKIKVKNGNFNMPTSLLAGSAIVRREQTQYFDFDPNYWVTKDPSYNSQIESLEAKTIRQQLSLNTCVGCHAGETKTRFTQINALAYGESANYWSATIDGATGIPQDRAFYPWGGTDPLQLGGMNKGETDDQLLNNVINFDVQTEINHHDFFQHISAFLTGRRFTSFDDPIHGSDTWQDDETDDLNVEDIENHEYPDFSLDGYFYVNDPSNNIITDQFPYLHNKKWGYNDLLRREKLLCAFLNSSCNGTGSELEFTALNLMANLSFVPLPLGAH